MEHRNEDTEVCLLRVSDSVRSCSMQILQAEHVAVVLAEEQLAEGLC